MHIKHTCSIVCDVKRFVGSQILLRQTDEPFSRPHGNQRSTEQREGGLWPGLKRERSLRNSGRWRHGDETLGDTCMHSVSERVRVCRCDFECACVGVSMMVNSQSKNIGNNNIGQYLILVKVGKSTGTKIVQHLMFVAVEMSRKTDRSRFEFTITRVWEWVESRVGRRVRVATVAHHLRVVFERFRF